MDLKDNFEDDNELSGLEEDDELGAEVVETEEEELIIGEEEPEPAPAPPASACSSRATRRSEAGKEAREEGSQEKGQEGEAQEKGGKEEGREEEGREKEGREEEGQAALGGTARNDFCRRGLQRCAGVRSFCGGRAFRMGRRRIKSDSKWEGQLAKWEPGLAAEELAVSGRCH